MSAETQDNNTGDAETKDIPAPVFRMPRTEKSIDFATLIGLFSALGLILVAIVIGQSNASFFNAPALLIVFFGTIAATSISFTAEELARAGKVIARSLVRERISTRNLAKSLMDLSLIARKKGFLFLSNEYPKMQSYKHLRKAMELVVDGLSADHIEMIIRNEIEAQKDRHRRSASITRRASEVAPAMGLIGTLVGLVQMLADLQNPEMIGPAMAVALLTTLYGAILGTIVMGPLAIKLEKYSADEVLSRTLIKITATAIARQENPRRLEMLLNSELPPTHQIKYFD